MRRFSKLIFTMFITILTIGIALFADEVIPETASAVTLCLSSIIPSLLPFFICSRMLQGLGLCERIGAYIQKPFVKCFHLPPSFSGGFILGSISGFPMGAKLASTFCEAGSCTKRQAAFGALLCNNAGPLFIIGTLGNGFLKNSLLGKQLWMIHLASSIITFLFFRSWLPEPQCFVSAKKPKTVNVTDLFVESVSDAVQTILHVCGLIIFFRAAIRTLICLGMPNSSLLIGCIEMTTGLSVLSSTESKHLLPLCSFLLSFGGVSVFMQVATVFRNQKIPLFPYLFGKTIQGGISATLTYLFYSIFPQSLPTFQQTNSISKTNTEPLLLVLSIMLLALGVLVNRLKISRDSP